MMWLAADGRQPHHVLSVCNTWRNFMLEFEILAQGCFPADKVDIPYQPEERMPMTPAIQAWMDALWEERLSQARALNKRLFDAPLYRLVGAETTGERLTLH